MKYEYSKNVFRATVKYTFFMRKKENLTALLQRDETCSLIILYNLVYDETHLRKYILPRIIVRRKFFVYVHH